MRQIGFISAMVLFSACSSASDDDKRILAEVGTDALTYGEVKTAIPYAVWQADSSNATNEYVKQWTMSRLLATEAERLGLHELSDVAERIRIHRDDVLIETLRDRALNSLTDEIRVTESEIEAYFETHKDQFTLRERHVRLRMLSAMSLDLATAARAELDNAGDWNQIVDRYAADKDASLASSETLRSLTSIDEVMPEFLMDISTISPRSISRIRQVGGQFVFIQLLETYPPGSVPDISWAKDRILDWLTIEKRRLALLSFEQNLLLKAQAEGTVRNPSSP